MKKGNGTESSRCKVWEIIPTLGGGGAEKMVLELAEGLKNSPYETTVISLYDKEYATTGRLRFAEENGLNIRYLHKKSGFDIRLLFRLAKLIKTEKPDIIHSHIESFQYVAILGFFLRFHHIHTMHSVAGREPKLYQKLLRSVSKRCRTDFAVLSNQIMGSMQKLFGTKKEYLHCIKNGVDTEHFQFKKRVFDPDSVGFIAVGSLIPVKNHRLLLEAFAELEKQRKQRDRLTIVGDGKLRDELKQAAIALGIEQRVTFTGNMDDVLPFLYQSDIFVMTSHYEGVSLALLEAASTGLPLIVSATGGTPELVGENAILFEDDQKNQLISAIQSLICKPEVYVLQSKKSRQTALANSKEKMINRYMELYAKVSERKKEQ